ncbi:alpha/beta fold hydrolase [Franconibacter pulveris 1160]|uniref:alpha/beta fold hydrolase n=1 Tax=Franconibacter pulveris TaxID=435910 RepID=UPI000463F9FE|nr:alpha/beta hydrolase [Franconibacter pulveris]
MKTFYSRHAGCFVRYHDFPGDGEPLLMVHGLGCASSYDYPRVVIDPAFGGRRAVLIDLPGSGYSEKPRHYAYGTSDQAQVVMELAQTLNLSAFWLYGHSMGGSIAIEAAQQAGERLLGLAVSEPNFHPGGGQFSRIIAAYSEEQFMHEEYPRMIEQYPRLPEEEEAAWAGSLLSNAPWAMWRGATALVKGSSVDWYQAFLSLSKPKQLIFGERSLPDDDFSSLAAAGASTAVIPAAGHSMSWENPSALAKALQGFCQP